MAEPRRVSFLDVFTERPLAGNGLAVVADADGLSDEVMLAFARETRLSETTYLQSPSEDGADYRNRIWTPSEELPYAGHPSRGGGGGCPLARAQRVCQGGHRRLGTGPIGTSAVNRASKR